MLLIPPDVNINIPLLQNNMQLKYSQPVITNFLVDQFHGSQQVRRVLMDPKPNIYTATDQKRSVHNTYCNSPVFMLYLGPEIDHTKCLQNNYVYMHKIEKYPVSMETTEKMIHNLV